MFLDWSWPTQVPGVVMEQNQGGQCQGLADLHYKKRLSYRIKAKPDHATMCGLFIYNNRTSILTLASLHDMLPLCYPTATQQKRFINDLREYVFRKSGHEWLIASLSTV